MFQLMEDRNGALVRDKEGGKGRGRERFGDYNCGNDSEEELSCLRKRGALSERKRVVMVLMEKW